MMSSSSECIIKFTSIISALVLFTSLVNGQNDPVVNTSTGFVRGAESSTVGENRTYYSFKGIPYAESPTGDLRFEPPIPKSKWAEIFDATQEGNICVQGSSPSVEGAEDCLFLNVYTPRLPSWYPKSLPVMVYIHGGGFEGGSCGYDLSGPDYLLEKDVVVVTLNYRLGIFGFLTTGDLVVPGNNGLKDQTLALKWIKDNVGKFGGDPEKITIFGQSAGAASVAYHMQSPLSQGLFHQAIMDSGVSLSTWAFNRHSLEFTQSIADDLGIDTTNSANFVAALRSFNASLLQGVVAAKGITNSLRNIRKDTFVYAPVLEPEHAGAFLTKKSHQQLSEGDFAKVPCLLGFNSLEGAFESNRELFVKMFFVQYDIDVTRFTPESMNVDQGLPMYLMSTDVKNHYFGSEPVFLSLNQIMKYLSNHQFDRPIVEFARLIHEQVPVYLYRFSYEGGLWNQNRTFDGVSHSEELGYLFRSKFEPSLEDAITRERMVLMWTNFVITGYPTPRPNDITENVIWKPFDENYTYLDIGNHLISGNHPEKENLEFWDFLFKTFGHPPYDSY